MLLLGMQWIGDPIEVRLRGDWNLTADWNDLDDTDLDDSHHHGLTEHKDLLLITPAMPVAGLAFLEWLPPPSDPDKVQLPPHSPWTPRAPPIA